MLNVLNLSLIAVLLVAAVSVQAFGLADPSSFDASLIEPADTTTTGALVLR